tara:strand:- start:949 stop:2745 length:1797 start_codon:yes stop_codon:yes gene_type:complete
VEYSDIQSIADLREYVKNNNLSGSQIFALTRKLGLSESIIKSIADSAGEPAPQADAALVSAVKEVTPPTTFTQAKRLLNDETAVKKALEFAKMKANPPKNVDVRTLEEKETEFIKRYVEDGILGEVDFKQDTDLLIPGAADLVAGVESQEAIDLRGQIEEETKYIESVVDNVVTGGELPGEGEPSNGQPGNGQSGGDGEPKIQEPPQGGIQTVDLLNAPDGAYIWNVDGNLYVAYEVPGARGEVYDGPPMFMAYTVPNNDLVGAGLISPEAPAPFISQLLKEDFDAVTILQSGNTDQLTSLIDHPFASFAETLESQIAVAPWLEETEAIGLLAEAALEGREVTDAEWQGTNWWKTHSDAERDWLITYNSDPATAQQLTTDAQLAVANSLQAAGVSNAPEAIINWVADKYISGQWSQAYTTEQVSLFADPYATGKRDENFENYLSSTAITGVDRTSERELEVKELYAKWLGPTLGKLTSEEVSEIAGQLRDDPEYKDSLIQNLKQNRLAAFSAYTNPELTYEDIARPWRNLTTSVWGQTADETQGWWQEMVKTNDFAKAQETLREKGIEQDITQVTQTATKALQQALGQGQVSQSGVNV